MTTRVPPELDAPAVAAWLAGRGVDLRPPFTATRLVGGRSNLTFKLTDGAGRAVVVRRPPLGHLLDTAHDVGREWRYLSALTSSPVPVPSPLAFCEAPDIIGAPFLVMEFVDGAVLHRIAEAAAIPETQRAAAAASLVDAMAELHRLDPATLGLATEGAPQYLRRQLDRWSSQYDASARAAGRPMARAFLDSARRLGERAPARTPIGIVHGDFRLGNCILGTSGQVAAVVDWEMATVGSVLADLGWLLASWFEPGEPYADTSPTSLAGFPRRRDVVARYAERTGFDLGDLNFFVAMGQWKAAGVLAGVAARLGSGAFGRARDTTHIHEQADAMAAAAAAVLDGAVGYGP
jgi:aminoglycoside phosphotransferase (APT) family kinase protein